MQEELALGEGSGSWDAGGSTGERDRRGMAEDWGQVAVWASPEARIEY